MFIQIDDNLIVNSNEIVSVQRTFEHHPVVWISLTKGDKVKTDLSIAHFVEHLKTVDIRK